MCSSRASSALNSRAPRRTRSCVMLSVMFIRQFPAQTPPATPASQAAPHRRATPPCADLSAHEPGQGLHEPLRVVEPGKVSAARLHGQLGLTEQTGILGGALGGKRDVVLARDEKDRRPSREVLVASGSRAPAE